MIIKKVNINSYEVFEDLLETYSLQNNREKIYNLKIHKTVIKYAVRSYAGSRLNKEKINQDCYFTIENYMQIRNFYFFGVCDGHGST